ncbi:disulfide bond formation regulator [Nonlabens sp. YIK11]|uniref:OsmC family protein n=1 Tax=Nonlabens sp. YIK11 TaxID=1453349 RepID=UPI0006DC429D|nr:OsmC family protein [Nonlabens sp. YIK11]KQC34201.1 disulfide bond formation regulator [Nonlabens sp. YIK11]
MKVTLERKNMEYLLEAKGASGIPVMIDNKGSEIVQGSSPMELILMGVGGCSAIDIISILKKQKQEIDNYKVEVTGDRVEQDGSKPFKAIQVMVSLAGAIDAAKAQRAADLSFQKYCSVSKTFDSVVEITYHVILNGKAIS